MTAINPHARAAALRCIEAGMPLLVLPGDGSAELAVDDAKRFLEIEQTNIGAARLYQIRRLSPAQ